MTSPQPKKFQILFFLSLLVWLAVMVWYAGNRTLWCDEFVRYDEVVQPWTDGFAMFFSEPSPFAPGELVLYYASKALTGPFLPTEIWARLPSLFWGVVTLISGFRVAQLSGVWLLVPLCFFSVALGNFSALMRPYAALIASGALGLWVLWEPQWKGNPLRFLLTPLLLFSHLYGICFIAFAALLRKLWLEVVLGAGFVLWILSRYQIHPHQGDPLATGVSLVDIGRQIVGVLGNPHGAGYLTLPLFLIGLLGLGSIRQRWKQSPSMREDALLGGPSRGSATLLLFFVSVAGPLAATFLAHYFFVPRQIVGGVVPFLFFVALGVEQTVNLASRKARGLPRKRNFNSILRPALATFLVGAIGVFPWVKSQLRNEPPFVDQPQHRLKDVVPRVYGPHRLLLSLDPCQKRNLVHYFHEAFGSQFENRPDLGAPGSSAALQFLCDQNSFCLASFIDSNLCSRGPDAFDREGLLSQGLSVLPRKPDFILHSWEHPDEGTRASGIPALRSW